MYLRLCCSLYELAFAQLAIRHFHHIEHTRKESTNSVTRGKSVNTLSSFEESKMMGGWQSSRAEYVPSYGIPCAEALHSIPSKTPYTHTIHRLMCTFSLV